MREEQESSLSGLMQVGIVAAVSGRLARVKLPETGEISVLQAQLPLTSDRVKANNKFSPTGTKIGNDNNLQEKLNTMESKLQRIENLLNALTEKK